MFLLNQTPKHALQNVWLHGWTLVARWITSWQITHMANSKRSPVEELLAASVFAFFAGGSSVAVEEALTAAAEAEP